MLATQNPAFPEHVTLISKKVTTQVGLLANYLRKS